MNLCFSDVGPVVDFMVKTHSITSNMTPLCLTAHHVKELKSRDFSRFNSTRICSVSTIYIYSPNVTGIYNIYFMASDLQPYVDLKLTHKTTLYESIQLQLTREARFMGSKIYRPQDCFLSVLHLTFYSLLSAARLGACELHFLS